MKKNQFKIGKAFENMIANLAVPETGFIWFDFHHECRGMKWGNISKLIEKIENELKTYEYFYAVVDFTSVFLLP